MLQITGDELDSAVQLPNFRLGAIFKPQKGSMEALNFCIITS
jgi:hypothetical protein